MAPHGGHCPLWNSPGQAALRGRTSPSLSLSQPLSPPCLPPLSALSSSFCETAGNNPTLIEQRYKLCSTRPWHFTTTQSQSASLTPRQVSVEQNHQAQSRGNRCLYQRCRIGRDVCFIATRTPPWSRYKTLCSSSKIWEKKTHTHGCTSTQTQSSADESPCGEKNPSTDETKFPKIFGKTPMLPKVGYMYHRSYKKVILVHHKRNLKN